MKRIIEKKYFDQKQIFWKSLLGVQSKQVRKTSRQKQFNIGEKA